MLDDWNPLIILPTIKADVAIKSANAALFPFDDPIILALRKGQQKFGEFLSRFTDAFEEPLEPAVLCIRVGAPGSYFSSAAVGAFRDLLSMSVVPYQRAKRLVDVAAHDLLRAVLHPPRKPPGEHRRDHRSSE